MCDIYANIITKDNQKVLAAVQKFLGDIPEFHTWMVEGCSNVGTVDADWAVVAEWFKFWKDQGMMKVYSTMYHNLVPHMADVKTHMSYLKDHWNA